MYNIRIGHLSMQRFTFSSSFWRLTDYYIIHHSALWFRFGQKEQIERDEIDLIKGQKKIDRMYICFFGNVTFFIHGKFVIEKHTANEKVALCGSWFWLLKVPQAKKKSDIGFKLMRNGYLFGEIIAQVSAFDWSCANVKPIIRCIFLVYERAFSWRDF